LNLYNRYIYFRYSLNKSPNETHIKNFISSNVFQSQIEGWTCKRSITMDDT